LGIDVSKRKAVSVNERHDRLVITEPSKNPVEYDIGIGKYLTAVYQRKKARSRSGDGNPLIYALKNMYRFTISEESKSLLHSNMKTIVSRHYESEEFDSVIAMPSSKPIAEWVGNACSEALNVPLEKNVFIKATNANVLNQIQKIEGDQEIIELRKALEAKKANGAFNLKDLSQHQRAFVEPVRLNPFYNKYHTRVLLVDDLVSSGTTFKSGYNLFKERYPDTEVDCLSLLGPVT
jgi:predicted amidophosphoribosyltransferase